jgi:hypothetical protein
MKNPRAPRLVTVSIFTTITVVFWVFFTVYNILTSKPPVEVDPDLLTPLDPTLNTDTLSTLPSTKFYEEGEVNTGPYAILGENEQTPVAEPTPTGTTATSSATFLSPTIEQPSPTPATSSAINQ